MAQEYASGGQLSEDVEGALEGDGGSTHDDSSTRLEQFGLGVAASILLGAVVGVAASWSIGGALPLIIALGLGFIFSPVVGVLVLRRSE
ncbi:hypothetical protein [Halobellus clavatus]|jgi:hypothetical protein|uniref:Glycine zipper-like domain-containing protein n=1 Tax=Halobellus clavatus TaxID=660517 RepID=A0A1H3EYB5_9EURY|nr:hypothetical protein [Halobellus clavatus]SDX83600.1 hypothetical protein SAMN04487946_10321 [Halobellus clavatus]